MDGLELLVHKRALHQVGQARAIVQEELPVAECSVHLADGGRHVGRVGQGASGRPDPVLRPAELARRHVRPTHALHEALMQLTYEAQ